MGNDNLTDAPVGIIGLGAMGAAYAQRLLERGHPVIGFDRSADAMAAVADSGGRSASSAAEVAAACRILITALSTAEAVAHVSAEIAAVPGSGGWVIDTNTLSAQQKEEVRSRLEPAGWNTLDCTVSGHPNMVVASKHTFYVSGSARPDEVEAVLRSLAEDYIDVGQFGRAATVKLLVNHLVICHDAVTAEVMGLADAAGIERHELYDLVTGSAGNSKIFEIRGRMMADRSYPAATMYDLIVDKDGPLIADLARGARYPTPIFATALNQHVASMAAGWEHHEPASMVEALSGRRPGSLTDEKSEWKEQK